MSLLIAVVLAALLVASIILWAGAALSLDRQQDHSRATSLLPQLLPGRNDVADGLVQIRVDDMVFRARVRNLAGSNDAVILLHGWPQSSIAWESLSAAAAECDFRVVAFDQRGYSPGARPSGPSAYTINKLVADVLAVADALGFDRFHLVGHDWGAAVGWAVVMTAPHRVVSWSALSIPHSVSFVAAIRTDPRQRRKSAYILLLRTPWLAEAILGWGRHRVLRRVMYRFMPAEHAEEYLRILAEPGALTAVLNWYRAMGKGPALNADPGIVLPVLFAWGNRDPAVARTAVEDQARFMLGNYNYLELDAGHWLLEHRGAEIIAAILQHMVESSDYQKLT